VFLVRKGVSKWKEKDMGNKQFSNAMRGLLAIFAAIALLVGAAGAGNPERVLFSFSGGNDGGYPDSDLIRDGAGNLYGTSVEGGTFGSGTVFELTRAGTGWTHTVLYNFTSGADGGQPYGGVTLDAQGNLYGTAVVGGTGGNCVDGGCGVVFKLTNSGASWSETVLHNFTGGNDGYGPGGGVTFDHHGNLYGMTPTGGANGLGVIYEMKQHRNGNWTEAVIHTFTGGLDGATGSVGRLILDGAGHLYGVATVGGANGDGVAFELVKNGGKWLLKTLYSFMGQPDAGYPYGALAMDDSGNLYGTTYYDGASYLGSVYKLTRNNGAWSEAVLYSFRGGTDGASPISNLVFDGSGNLYGTTSAGGIPACDCGTIFKLTPRSNGSWTESVAYRFKGVPDGGFAYNGMLGDSAGNFYGTTVHGGIANEGAIYKFTP
jgi:uncharacterized repeat protein (TIGR03803 family)